MDIYYNKYIKYKSKFKKLKNIIGGGIICQMCTFYNESNVNVCKMCNHKLVQPTIEHEIQKLATLNTSLDTLSNCIICQICTFYNESHVNFCEMCNYKLVQPAIEHEIQKSATLNTSLDTLSNGIICKLCSFYNEPHEIFCKLCNNKLEETTDTEPEITESIQDQLKEYEIPKSATLRSLDFKPKECTEKMKEKKTIQYRTATIHLEKLIQDITEGNFESMFEKVDYIDDSSNGILEIRLIDVLLHNHYDYKFIHDGHTELQLRNIEILKKLDPEILRRIFNDGSLKYPYANRRHYLQEKPGSTMSTMLLSKFLLIYDYVISTIPDIELNIVDDLSIIFDHMLCGIVDEKTCDIKINSDLYMKILNHLLTLNSGNLEYSSEWFDSVIRILETEYNDKIKVKWFRDSDIKGKRLHFCTSKSIPNKIANILKNYRSWEYADNTDFDRLIIESGINRKLLLCIKDIFTI
jgi:hypothetical protein